MYNKSKNRMLFAIFILVVLLIISILILSVYNTKEKNNIEEYKISLNNAIYDKDYSYISLKKDSVLKKEWDGNYYLYENDNKYELGKEPVFYDKAKNQVSIYGNVYQIYTNGEAIEKTEKIVVNDLSDFQFFKLGDRKYLVINSEINNENFSAHNYLIVSIDKAGNATLLNNSLNIKTINPLVISIGDVKFDVANEKLIVKDKEIDLKKINGSTNEYVEGDKNKKPSNIVDNNISNDQNSGTNGNTNQNNNSSNNSPIYNQIISQIINISGLVSSQVNKANLYKNIGLRTINAGASYLDIVYSVIDPEDKYLSVFLVLEDEDKNQKYYYLNKGDISYRISGLSPNKQYNLSINYISRGNSSSVVADSVVALTSTDPTSVRITKINGTSLFYKIKMYSEYEFSSANVILTNCEDTGYLALNELNIGNALSNAGDTGEFILSEGYMNEYVCLSLNSVKDANGNDITINSYHKVKIN